MAETKKQKAARTVALCGLEDQVNAYRQKKHTHRWLGKELDEIKKIFRDHATRQQQQNAHIDTVTFESPDGKVTVSLPDLRNEQNRNNVPDKDIEKSQGTQWDLADMTSADTTFTLAGPMADWFKNLMQSWVDSGAVVPADHISVKETTRLTDEAVAKLQKAAADGDDGAALILSRYTRSATVR